MQIFRCILAASIITCETGAHTSHVQDTSNNPFPADAAVVAARRVRLTALSSGLVRIQTRAADDTSQWDDRPTLHVINRRLPVPSFTYNVSSAGDEAALVTSELTVSVSALESRAEAHCVASGGVHSWTWAAGTTSQPIFASLINEKGMYLLDDTATWRMDAGTSVPWIDHGTTRQTDFYFFCYGSAFAVGLRQLTSITGPTAMMPHAAYGVWWCQCCPAYREGTGPMSFDREILQQYRNLSLPLSVAVLDMDWHKSGWNSYTWDPSLFSDPRSFVQSLHDGSNGYGKPLKLALNIHPGAYRITPKDESRTYSAFSRAMGVDPKQKTEFECNLFNKSYAQALMSTILDGTGADFFWDDCFNCTWHVFGTSGRDGGSCGDGISTNVDGNLWSSHVLNSYSQAVHSRRPLTLNRLPGVAPSNVVTSLLTNPQLTISAGLAGHRYPAAWTGDINGDWGTLAAHVRLFPAAAATLLYVYYSADLGGFRNTQAESYVRWLQWGAFSPIFRTHGSRTNEKRIWKFATFPQLADAMRLRDAMVPWLYSLAFATYRSSEPFIRPMWFDHPELLTRKPNASTCAESVIDADVGSGSVRSASHPNGLLVTDQSSCCTACDDDKFCKAWIYASQKPDSGPNCWLMSSISSIRSRSGRVMGQARDLDSQYLFGHAIVRPITEAASSSTGLAQAAVWLPRGDWVRWDGYGGWQGPTEVTANFSISEIPVYVPRGSLFPLRTPQNAAHAFTDPLVWVAMASGEGHFTVYEDDGESLDYLSGSASSSALTYGQWNGSSVKSTLAVSPVQGSFLGMPSSRAHWMQIRGMPKTHTPISVECNGNSLDAQQRSKQGDGDARFWYCGDADDSGDNSGKPSLSCPNGALMVSCPPVSNTAGSTISVTWSDSSTVGQSSISFI